MNGTHIKANANLKKTVKEEAPIAAKRYAKELMDEFIENQAISRAYRMGQARNVLVYRLLCENSVDEKIMSILGSKQTIFDAFADKSVAASQSLELDDKTFGNIIKEGIDRINAKHRDAKSDTTGA